jgi:hypothetical protein
VKVAISQPTYLPWVGYFDLIDQVDLFVILDNVQFVKQSWQHRNRIKTATGLQWLTVPIKFRGHFGQLIENAEIRDLSFGRDHLRAIELAYRRAPFFDDYFAEITNYLAAVNDPLLANLNILLINCIMQKLQITTPVVRASSLGQTGKRTELLANICGAVGATEYLSPLGSAVYLIAERQSLISRGVEICFQNYAHPVYDQLFGSFEPFACALDLLFNEGPAARNVVTSGRRLPYSVEAASLIQKDRESSHSVLRADAVTSQL